MYSASPSSTTEPPASWFAARIASITTRADAVARAAGRDRSTTCHCRTMPPTAGDFGHVGHDFSS
jgi:hypothetical protein